MSLKVFAFLLLSFQAVNGDCPLSHYPRSTVIGYIHAQINNEKELHNQSLSFSYPLEIPLKQSNIDVAIAIVQISFIANDRINFYVKHQPSQDKDQIKFRVWVSDEQNGWQYLRFSFLATHSILFQMNGFQADEFSQGLEEGSYGIYRRLPNIQNHSAEIMVKVFVSGANLLGRSLNTAEYEKLQRQHSNFKKFSTNKKLIQYFDEALVQYKGLSLEVSEEGIVGNFLAFNIKTNSVLKQLFYTYIIFSNKALEEMHNQVSGSFKLFKKPYEIAGLENMGMMFSGLTSFTIPRNAGFEFQLSFDQMDGKGIFGILTSHEYLIFGFSYLAIEIQDDYVCSDCPESRIIHESYCLDDCPRSYSLVKGKVHDFCQLCNIEYLKVINQKTLECECAKRTFRKDAVHCQMCRYDCLSCKNQNECLTCDDKKQTNRKLSNGRCVCPTQGFFDDGEGINCRKCHHSCKSCNGPLPHNCLTCESDKSLDSFGHCKCNLNFALDENGKCTCNPPIFIGGECVTPTVNCTENQVEVQIGFGKKCECKDGFTPIGSECVKCKENEIFNDETLKCECTNKTVLLDGKCVPCGNNQVYSSETNTCVCKKSTFQSEDGRSCIQCPPKMTYENGACVCMFNYYESSPGKCSRCTQKTNFPRCRAIQI